MHCSLSECCKATVCYEQPGGGFPLVRHAESKCMCCRAAGFHFRETWSVVGKGFLKSLRLDLDLEGPIVFSQQPRFWGR